MLKGIVENAAVGGKWRVGKWGRDETETRMSRRQNVSKTSLKIQE